MNMETAAQSMKELKGRADSSATHTPPHHQVHRTGATPVSSTSAQVESGPSTCYRCGFRGHTVFSAGQTRTLSVISVARRAT